MGIAENLDANEWNSSDATFGLDLGQYLDPTINAIQNVLAKINVILNTTLEILEFVKAFVTNLLDPILALIKQIIDLLKGLLEFNQLGIYFVSDTQLVLEDKNYNALKGGYLGFQNRMIQRWLKDDPNKPDFKASGALAVYFYGSSDFVEGLDPIIITIQKIINLFKSPIKEKPSLPPITNMEVSIPPLTETEKLYGTPEQYVRVSFELATRNSPMNVQPNVGGFVVQMSSFQNGLLAGYSKPIMPLAKTKEGVIKTQGLYYSGIDAYRVFSETLDPFVDGDSPEYSGEEDNRIENFLLRNPLDTERLDVNFPQECGKHLFFQVLQPTLSSARYSVDIPFSELPNAIDTDGNVLAQKKISFRAFAVDKKSAKKIKSETGRLLILSDNPAYNFTLKATSFSERTLSLDFGEKNPFIPSFSPIVELDNINTLANRQSLEQAIKESLYACLLIDYGRCSSEYTRYEKVMIELEKIMFGGELYSEIKDKYEKKDLRTTRNLFERKINRATKILLRNCPQAIGTVLVNFPRVFDGFFQTAFLDDKKYLSYQQVYHTIEYSRVLSKAIGLDNLDLFEGINSPVSIGDSYSTSPSENSKIGEDRNNIISKFVSFEDLLVEEMSQETFETEEIWYECYLFENTLGEPVQEILTQCLEFISLLIGTTMPEKRGEWLAYRPFADGFPEFEAFIENSIKFFTNIQEGLEGFGEKIIKAIEHIEIRIQQIQSLIALINQILEILKNLEITFDVPLGALAHIGTGNQELMEKLITSTNKPNTDGSGYTVGALVVAGGAPTFLIELIASLFVESE